MKKKLFILFDIKFSLMQRSSNRCCQVIKMTMKKKLLLPVFSFAILLFACSKNTNSTDKINNTVKNYSLAGKWSLVETLQDPGDGSGKWQPADATKNYFIKFNEDRSVESNSYTVLDGIKKYIVVNDSIITFINTNNQEFQRYYKVDSSSLTIRGGCYEACGSKFIRAF